MKIDLLIIGSLILTGLMACQPQSAGTASLQGHPNSGGRLRLEKTYDLIVSSDPRLMKSKFINFLSYSYRDYSFSAFLVDTLTANTDPLPCELLDLTIGDKKSLITKVVDLTSSAPQFQVFAADLVCDAPPSP